MAQRRMFSLKVIDTDSFLAMPTSSRLLYYDLAMRADDDGFVNSPQKIVKMTGAALDDLKILEAKKYIIPFDTGVCVIKHWHIHNLIRTDRYNETDYKDEKKALKIIDNKYEYIGCQNVIPHDNQMAPQVRLGKDRLNNSCSPDGERPSVLGKKEGMPTKENVKEQGFEEFWKLYPRQQGRINALKSWKTKGCSTKTQAILASLSFRLSAAPPNGWAGIETNFVPLPATFLNQQRWEDTPVPAKVGDMPEEEKARRIEIFKAKEAWKAKRDRLSLIENIKHGRARDLRTLEEKAADVILEAEGLEEWDKSWD